MVGLDKLSKETIDLNLTNLIKICFYESFFLSIRRLWNILETDKDLSLNGRKLKKKKRNMENPSLVFFLDQWFILL